MRKLFIGTMLTSLLGAFIIGGVLAWSNSATGPSSALAGNASASFFNYAPTGNKVVPNDSYIKVAQSGFTNTGDIAVHATGGSVANIDIPGGTACNNDMDGAVNAIDGTSVAPLSNFGYAFDVYLRMNSAAENDCQGKTINYDVTINVGT